MSIRERAADKGARRAKSIVTDLGEELRRARLDHGLSQADVARAVKISRAQVSRIERAAAPKVSILQIARLLAVLGLELGARAYPAGLPIRDAAHRALIERLRARASPALAWRFEVPLGRVGDQRAWDLVLRIGAAQFAVEAETRPHDIQALQRRVSLKLRDDPGVSGVLLLLADTRHNRILLREHGPALRTDFPVPASEILRALAEGRVPGGSGILVL
jgi:transcriptional regulator with XRE-family HTH domain